MRRVHRWSNEPISYHTEVQKTGGTWSTRPTKMEQSSGMKSVDLPAWLDEYDEDGEGWVELSIYGVSNGYHDPGTVGFQHVHPPEGEEERLRS